MKKISKSLLYIFSMLVIIVACTKHVGLLTEVEFSLSEEHTTEGYGNEAMATTVTVVPEEQLEGYEYFYTYKVLSGEGYFEDGNGQVLPEGDKIPFDALSSIRLG